MESDEQGLKTVATAVYALQAAGFFVGITWIVAVIIDYVKRDDARGTWLESHYRWQIRTFWFGLLWIAIAAAGAFGAALVGGIAGWLSGRPDAAGWGAVGGLVIWTVIGTAIGLGTTIWLVYRIVKGWLRIVERREVA
jgi:uncharacterized membrane protein